MVLHWHVLGDRMAILFLLDRLTYNFFDISLKPETSVHEYLLNNSSWSSYPSWTGKMDLEIPRQSPATTEASKKITGGFDFSATYNYFHRSYADQFSVYCIPTDFQNRAECETDNHKGV